MNKYRLYRVGVILSTIAATAISSGAANKFVVHVF